MHNNKNEENGDKENYTPVEGEGSSNPNLTNTLNPEEQEKMKGDAIGDTLYSERFVLKTMLDLAELTKEQCEVKWSEDMENDLCTLWDMTTEKDVVIFLLEHDFVELSLSVIKKTDEIRLIEIMVGIVGNMCCFSETCVRVFESEYEVYLSLIKVTDTPLLIQLLRLIKSLLFKDAKHYNLIITDETFTQINFILCSSQNSELLLYTLQVFELIVNKKKSEIINDDTLINVNESFKQLLKNSSDTSGFISHEHEKIFTGYLKVIQNISLSLEELEDKEKYELLLSSLEKNSDLTLTHMEKILSFLCDPEPFHSMSENMEFYIYCIVQFINLLKSPFSVKILKLLITIFETIVNEKINMDGDVVTDLTDVICQMIKKGELSVLHKIVDSWSHNKIKHLLEECINKHKPLNCDKEYKNKLNELISV